MTHRYSELCSTGRLKFTQRADSKMTLIPIIFVLLRMWGTIRFFLAYSPSDPSFLVYLHVSNIVAELVTRVQGLFIRP